MIWLGAALFVVGAAGLKLALWVFDAPWNPGFLVMFGWITGVVSAGMIAGGTALFLGGLS